MKRPFKRREQMIQSDYSMWFLEEKMNFGGKGRLRLGVDWAVRLRSWGFLARQRGGIESLFDPKESGHQDSQ